MNCPYNTTPFEDALASVAKRYGCEVLWYLDANKIGHIERIYVNHGIFKGGREIVLRDCGQVYEYYPVLQCTNVGEVSVYTLVSDYATTHSFQSITSLGIDRFEDCLKSVLMHADQIQESDTITGIMSAQLDLAQLINSKQ